MKKSMLIALLVLAVITSLTAGTLAVYTNTVDLNASEVAAKQFAFTANWSNTTGYDIALAPGESQTISFNTTNTDNNAVAEVDLDTKVLIDLHDAGDAMRGLTATLLVNNVPVALANEDGKLIYEASPILTAGATAGNTYDLVFEWVDDGQSNLAHTNSGLSAVNRPIDVSIVATQVIGNANESTVEQ